jgi:hypothetical protein
MTDLEIHIETQFLLLKEYKDVSEYDWEVPFDDNLTQKIVDWIYTKITTHYELVVLDLAADIYDQLLKGATLDSIDVVEQYQKMFESFRY